MIARIWYGTTDAEKAPSYLEYLNQTGIPDYRHPKGNRGAYVLRRIEIDKAHFLTLSFWESLDAIKTFVCEDCERARYYPRDKEFLLEFEPTVTTKCLNRGALVISDFVDHSFMTSFC